jgi:hypothetical protein
MKPLGRSISLGIAPVALQQYRRTGTTMPVLEFLLTPNESIISEAGEPFSRCTAPKSPLGCSATKYAIPSCVLVNKPAAAIEPEYP